MRLTFPSDGQADTIILLPAYPLRQQTTLFALNLSSTGTGVVLQNFIVNAGDTCTVAQTGISIQLASIQINRRHPQR